MNLDLLRTVKDEAVKRSLTEADMSSDVIPMFTGWRDGEEIIVITMLGDRQDQGSAMSTLIAGMSLEEMDFCYDTYLASTAMTSLSTLMTGVTSLEEEFKKGNPIVTEALVHLHANLTGRMTMSFVPYFVSEGTVVYEAEPETSEIIEGRCNGMTSLLHQAIKVATTIPIPGLAQIEEAMRHDQLTPREQRIVLDALSLEAMPEHATAHYGGARSQEEHDLLVATFEMLRGLNGPQAQAQA